MVRLEFGARSDPRPSESREIRPLLVEALPQAFGESQVYLRALRPERTFWEKLLLLHEEMFRPETRKRRPRLARHYYDLWCLVTRGIGHQAMADMALFAAAAAHREIYFPQPRVDYSTMKRGSLHIIPTGDSLTAWRADYEAMRGAMLLGTPPTFDEVLRVLAEFQEEFNQS